MTTPARDRDRTVSSRRSEEHTSELQPQSNLVCRLLLGKKSLGEIASSRQMLGATGTISQIENIELIISYWSIQQCHCRGTIFGVTEVCQGSTSNRQSQP